MEEHHLDRLVPYRDRSGALLVELQAPGATPIEQYIEEARHHLAPHTGPHPRLLDLHRHQVVGLRAAKAAQRAQVVDRLEEIGFPCAVVSMDDVEVRPWPQVEVLQVAEAARP